MNKVIEDLEDRLTYELGKQKTQWNDDEKSTFQQRISEIAKNNFFGFDLNPDLVKATKMNMVMNNDGSGNIYQTNSLLPPHQWKSSFRNELTAALGIENSALSNHDSICFFDFMKHSTYKFKKAFCDLII